MPRLRCVLIVILFLQIAAFLQVASYISWKNTLGDLLETLENAEDYEVVTPRRLPPPTAEEPSFGGEVGNDNSSGGSGRWRREEAAPLRVFLPSSASGQLFIDLWPSSDVVSTDAEAIWSGGSTVPLKPFASCLHSGTVRGLPGSLAALSTCGGLTGLLRLRERTLLVRPLGGGTPEWQEHLLFRARGANLGMDTETVLRKVGLKKKARDSEENAEGNEEKDVMEHGNREDEGKAEKWREKVEEREYEEEEGLIWSDESEEYEEEENEESWENGERGRRERRRVKVAEGGEESGSEETWEEGPALGGRRPVIVSVPPPVSDHLGPTLAQHPRPTNRWLKMAIGVDHTVVRFHGRENVAQYVLALMNIVSAIYKDPSLDSNLRLVIIRMIFYEDEKDGQVEEGNPKLSLEHVNAWNEKLLKSIGNGRGLSATRHDVAVWLTRIDIGGPSGYAPVSGACDPERSCALNRDEGLSSAFIIAHEVGHVLGMTHDGDLAAGNDCGEEAAEGSVMAPMVASAFNRFHWSPCSKEEFHSKAPQWICLDDPPPHSTNAIVLGSSLHAAFSMDEQCRLEFGDGYTLCHSFDLPDPCTHLWCSHVASPLVCKTKKGPPLEGTECGYDKWCVNGYCETVDKKRPHKSVVRYNARDGGWSNWSGWGPCSRSCGFGVTFRTRKCDNPSPEFGGADCLGSGEEYDVCAANKCPQHRDFRAEQCSRLKSLIPMDKRLADLTWLSYEPEPVTQKCHLTCISRETGEVFSSGENLIDGTPCSYDMESGICIQGNCQDMGCDGVLESDVKEDACGKCAGNGSLCQNVTINFRRVLRRRLTRISVLPTGARHIRVEARSDAVDSPSTFLVLRDRRKRAFPLTGQENCIQRSGRSNSCAEGVKIPSSSRVVAEGALFHYEHHGPLQTLWAKGPILSELVLSISVLNTGPGPRSKQLPHLQMRVQGRYSTEGAAIDGRYQWKEGTFQGGSKWSPCSSTCGGGRQHKILVCTDTKLGKSVPRRLCSLARKPPNPSRPCNTFSCSFEWVAGPWEPCTATCGARGVKSREVYCVHSNVSSLITKGIAKPWENFVDPVRCGGPVWQWPRPTGFDTTMSCNRIPCPVEWVTGNWSKCEARDEGAGMWGEKRREARCPAPRGEPLFTCGKPPVEQKPCRLSQKKECQRDASNLCPKLSHLLGRYCVIPGFKEICCETCSRLPHDEF